MIYKGTILKIKQNEAIVMTERSNFFAIKKRPGMYLGQQLEFRKSDMHTGRSNVVKYILLAASIFVIAVISASYFQFAALNTAYAYIGVDINPSVELTIDKQEKVLKANPINKDAQTLLKGLKLEKMPLKEALSAIIKKSEEYGFIKPKGKNVIIISASLNADNNDYKQYQDNMEKNLDSLLLSCREVVLASSDVKVEPEVVKVTPAEREQALQNDLSMGKYIIYTKAKAEGADISIDEVKEGSVSEILDNVQIDDISNVDGTVNTDQPAAADQPENSGLPADSQVNPEGTSTEPASGETGTDSNTGTDSGSIEPGSGNDSGIVQEDSTWNDGQNGTQGENTGDEVQDGSSNGGTPDGASNDGVTNGTQDEVTSDGGQDATQDTGQGGVMEGTQDTPPNGGLMKSLE